VFLLGQLFTLQVSVDSCASGPDIVSGLRCPAGSPKRSILGVIVFNPLCNYCAVLCQSLLIVEGCVTYLADGDPRLRLAILFFMLFRTESILLGCCRFECCYRKRQLLNKKVELCTL
jgi:hypothetical protein